MKCKFHGPTSSTHLVVCNTQIFCIFFFNLKKKIPKQKHFGPKDREIKYEDHEV